MVSLRRISRACSKAKYQGKRRAGCKRSGRCATNHHEGRLRRGGVGQRVQGHGVSYLFVRILQCCIAERYVRNLSVTGRGQSGALNCRGVCAIIGIARTQADAPQLVMGASFGEAALASVQEGQAHFLVLGGFCQVASED